MDIFSASFQSISNILWLGILNVFSNNMDCLYFSAGTCPNIDQLPMIELCEGKESNCWSVGQADVDCPDNALCCFDGCINACYFGDRG